jgi:REP element-mobilizing transposase RayT
MRRARWIIKPKPESTKPIIYHCISRVVNREFVFEKAEKEQLRMFMRMYEVFSGNRILSYCLMSNHIHLLLEIVPAPPEGLTDEELLRRLRAIHPEAQVAEVAKELAEARKAVADGLADESRVRAIHARFTYRMHDLSQFMKSFTQRYTQWHNGAHQRQGRLWEDRFKSVIVEDGVAARTMAAYIDLNPVRAGMVSDPAGYRWSSYGEAVGGGNKGNGKKAREGLVRACMSHEGAGFEAEKWPEVSRIYRRAMGLALGRKSGKAVVDQPRRSQAAATGAEAKAAKDNGTVLPDLGMAAMLRHRVRYFTDGAVIGSKAFVNEAFAAARERFSTRRKDGARKMRGVGAAAASVLWSARDLRVDG